MSALPPIRGPLNGAGIVPVHRPVDHRDERERKRRRDEPEEAPERDEHPTPEEPNHLDVRV
ncbi:MAG: hypothetical protein JNJ45_11005 [Chthonomonas sp.]|nr:hypothetical protein [Chthonomonas sp.]